MKYGVLTYVTVFAEQKLFLKMQFVDPVRPLGPAIHLSNNRALSSFLVYKSAGKTATVSPQFIVQPDTETSGSLVTNGTRL